MLPWIVVGLGVVVALVISTIVINMSRADDSASSTEQSSSQQQDDAAAQGDGRNDQDDAKQDDEPDPDQPPQVDVGSTLDLDIQVWGVSAQVSSKFGSSVRYMTEGDKLILSSEVIDSLPDECAAMRSEWGAIKKGDSYEVLKPAETCDAAPELYETLWGLTDAFVKSIR